MTAFLVKMCVLCPVTLAPWHQVNVTTTDQQSSSILTLIHSILILGHLQAKTPFNTFSLLEVWKPLPSSMVCMCGNGCGYNDSSECWLPLVTGDWEMLLCTSQCTSVPPRRLGAGLWPTLDPGPPRTGHSLHPGG